MITAKEAEEKTLLSFKFKIEKEIPELSNLIQDAIYKSNYFIEIENDKIEDLRFCLSRLGYYVQETTKYEKNNGTLTQVGKKTYKIQWVL